MKKNIISSCVVAGLCSTAIFASDITVDFPYQSSTGTFYCTVPPTLIGKVSIDSLAVKVKGFCSGQKYVTSDGHIVDMPTTELNKYFFRIVKTAWAPGSVTIFGDVDMTCQEGMGEGREEYGEGGYC